MVAEDITVLPIGCTEVTIYDFPGEEYAFRRRKHFSVVVSWSNPFHGRERPTEKSFSVVVRQQAEGLVVTTPDATSIFPLYPKSEPSFKKT